MRFSQAVGSGLQWCSFWWSFLFFFFSFFFEMGFSAALWEERVMKFGCNLWKAFNTGANGVAWLSK